MAFLRVAEDQPPGQPISRRVALPMRRAAMAAASTSTRTVPSEALSR